MPGFKIGFGFGGQLLRRPGGGSPPPPPTLVDLTGTFTLPDTAALGDLAGTISGKRSGSTLSLVDDDGDRVALDGLSIERGATALVGEGGTAREFTVRETLAGATNSPHDTVLSYSITAVGPSPADYTITNDGDASTPNSFLNILALGASELAGKTVEIAELSGGAAYTAKTITIAPGTPTIFRAAQGDLPVIDRLTLNGAERLIFEGIKFVSSGWTTSATPCVGYQNTDDITFRAGCIFKSGYRGDWTIDIDPNADYPEYACIIPQFDDSGAVVSLIVTNDYVGDLVADGTGIEIEFASPTNFAWSVLPTGEMDVSGGYITAARVLTPGTSTQTTARNSSVGILSKCIRWVGQVPMGTHLSFGHQAVGGTIGAITVEDCEFYDLSNAFKVTPNDGSPCRVVGNLFERVYMDFISVGLAARVAPLTPYPPAPMTISWNVGRHPFSKVGDAQDPHADAIQFYMQDEGASNTWTTEDWPIEIVGNRFYDGNARGCFQGQLISEVPQNGIAYIGRVVGNVTLSNDNTVGLALDAMRDTIVYRNVAARIDPTDPANTSAVHFRTGNAPSHGANLVASNIYETVQIDNGGNASLVTFDGNLALGLNGASLSYGTVFADITPPPDTLAELMAAFAGGVGYEDYSPLSADGYIDYDARTVDLDLEPVFARFDNLTGQEPEELVESNWSRIIGGPASGPITITDGEYRFADDYAGTNATSWTSASGTYDRGACIQVRHETGSGSAETVQTDVSLNGHVRNFASTTESATAYPVVAFDGADRFVRSGALGSDGRYCTIAFKMKFPSGGTIPSTINVFTALNTSDAAGSAAVQVQILTTGLVRVNVWNAAGSSICQLNITAGSLCDGNVHEVLIDLDLDQATAGAGRRIYVDGGERTSATGAWAGGSGVQIGYSRVTGVAKYSLGGSNTVMLSSGVELHYFYLNIAERAGVDDAGVQGRFAASATSAGDGDAANVTGNAPHTFITGVASQWNDAGGINWGADTNYIAAAGSAVTDVSGSAWS